MNQFEPLSPSTLLKHVNLRVDAMIGLLKMVGPAHISSAMKDEILILHNLVLDHICDDPEGYAESASAMLRLRDHHTIPGQTIWRALPR